MPFKPRVVVDNAPVVSANQALDITDKNYLVVLAFADLTSFSTVWDVVCKKCSLLGIQLVRVEPSEDAAVTLQLNKHPTYILYRSGNEEWMVVGNEAFMSKIDLLRP